MILKIVTYLTYIFEISKIVMNNWRAYDPEKERELRQKAKEGYALAKDKKDPSLISKLINQ